MKCTDPQRKLWFSTLHPLGLGGALGSSARKDFTRLFMKGSNLYRIAMFANSPPHGMGWGYRSNSKRCFLGIE